MRRAASLLLSGALFVLGTLLLMGIPVSGGENQNLNRQDLSGNVASTVSWGSADGCVQNMGTNDFGMLTPNATSSLVGGFDASPQANASMGPGGEHVWVGCVTTNGPLVSVVAEGLQDMSDTEGDVLPLSDVAIGVTNKPDGKPPVECAISPGENSAGNCTLPTGSSTARSLVGESPAGTTELNWQYQLDLPADQRPGAYHGGEVIFTATAEEPTISQLPENLAAPQITPNTPQEGSQESASTGSWSNDPTGYTYRWQRCDSAGENCTDLTGATSSTYVPTAEDVAHTLRVLVTAENSEGEATALSDPTGLVIPEPPSSSTPPPEISGDPIEGSTLHTTKGTFIGGAITTTTYQWSRCESNGESCMDILGATSPSYTLTADDVGHTILVEVQVGNAAGAASESSAPTIIIVGAPSDISAPVLSPQPPQKGIPEHASTGSWSNEPTNYTYQWQLCDSAGENCTDISGAESSTYTPVSGDVAHTLRISVLASNAAGEAQAFSSSSEAVLPGLPTNTTPPSISSKTPTVGVVESADVGVWSNEPTSYSYQWEDCNVAGAGCVTIAGANSATYTPVAADAADTLVVEVSAANAAGSATAISEPTENVTESPVNTTLPELSTTMPSRGTALSTSNGSWAAYPAPIYTYRWQRCDAFGANCTDIPGASASSYTPQGADAGQTLRAVVTATNSAGSQSVNTLTSEIVSGAPENLTAPSLSSTSPVQGQPLTAAGGSWSAYPQPSFSYQWERCNSLGESCTPIGGATSATYTPAEADVGSELRVTVTATNTFGMASAASAPSKTVIPLAPVNLSAPALSPATPRQGVLESTTNGTWENPVTGYSYQWQDCDSSGENCSNIVGATAATYTPLSADVGHTLRAVVTATNNGGSTPATSGPSGQVVVAAPVNLTLPSISPQTPTQGTQASASTGTWSNSPTSYSYQWEDCTSLGTSCIAISGATNSTYTPSASDVGDTLVVAVTASNSGGFALAVSEPTQVLTGPPVIVSAPQLSSNTPTQGTELAATTGTWTNSPSSYAYQWQRCNSTGENCSNISGATSSTYTPTNQDLGSTLLVSVTATNASGPSSPASSNLSEAVGIYLISTVAGNGTAGFQGEETSATLAELDEPQAVAVDSAGDIFIADTDNNRIREVSAATGKISTVAGNGTAGFQGEGTSATSAELDFPQGVAVDSAGDIFIADSGNERIREVSAATGKISTVAGTGTVGYNGDGHAATSATMDDPDSVAVDASGNIYVSERTNNVVREINASTGIITTVAGNGTRSYGGDGGPATQAELAAPESVAVDSHGNIYIADTGTYTTKDVVIVLHRGNARIREVQASTGLIRTVAGDGGYGYGGDKEPATSAEIRGSEGVGLDSSGNLYIADTGNQRVRAVNSQTQIINTVAGNGTEGYSGDGGSPTAAELDEPASVAIDKHGDLFIADRANNVIREVGILRPPVSTSPPTLSTTTPHQGTSLSVTTGGWANSPSSFAYQWQRCNSTGEACSNISGATTSSYTPVEADVGHTLVAKVSATNQAGTTSAVSTASAAVLPNPPVNTVLPKLSVTLPQQGSAISTTNGTWTGSPTSFTYQWKDCNSSGGGCTNIVGASASTYTPVGSDVGHTLVVTVTATNSGGSNSASAAHSSLVIAPAGTINEYSLADGEGIASGPDGNLWVAQQDESVSKITTAGVVSEYKLASPFSCPNYIAAGSDGNLWFTDDCDHQIGKITTSGSTTAFNFTSGVELQGIAAGPDGNLWFLSEGFGKVGKITTGGTVTEYTLPTSSRPEGIVAGPDGNLWFTEMGSNKIGKITTGGTVTEYSVPVGSEPYGIASGPDGNLWFTDSATSKVGKITTAGSLTEFSLPSNSRPNGIAAGGDGSLWFTESTTNKIGRITTAGAVTEYSLPAGSSPKKITSGPDGNLWFTTSTAVGEISPSTVSGVPVNSVLPSLSSSSVSQGSAVSVTNGTWSPSPTGFTYQWQDCNTQGQNCVSISGATSSSYTPTSSDVGSKLRAVVIAADGSGLAEAAAAVSSAVTPLAPANTQLPVISSNSPQQGVAESTTTGTWANNPTSFTYQWEDCNSAGESCMNISGATSSSYTPVAADVAETLRVAVTAANSTGKTEAVSNYTNAVLPAVPTAGSPLPVVSGSNVEFQTLSTTNGTWGGGAVGSYSYQWQRCGSSCTNIAGATSSTYTTTAADVGETIQVVVTASNAAGQASETSAPNGTYVDSSGNANTGSSSGSVTNAQSGPFNNSFAVGFAGSNSAPSQITSLSTPITSQTNWSLETWLDPSTLSQDGEVIYNGDDPGGNGYGFFVAGASGGDTVGGCLTGLYELITWIDTGYCFPAANQWYYVVETNNQGTVTFYVNGVSVYSGSPGTPNAPAGMIIGGYSSRWFQGKVSNAAFYNTILSASQISAHYAASTSQNAYSAAVLASAPRAYYQLNDWSPIVIAPPTASTPLPAISGSTVEFQTLSTTTGTFGGGAGTYTYKWQRCTSSCANISGATGSSYTTTAADVGDTIKVIVTSTNSSGSASETSAATSTITLAPPTVSTPLPAISGNAVQFGTLSSTNGTFGGGAVASYTYQWRRCNSAGEACSSISGATASKYTLATLDIGHTIRVLVTATNSGGSASETSAQTALVTELPPAGTLAEYALPSSSLPYWVTSGPDGNLWFTDEGTGKVGKITTTGTITEYTVPNDEPRGITTGPDGNLWFVEHSIREVDHITTSGVDSTYTLTHTGTFNIGIVTGPDENLWFAAESAGFIGKITTNDEVLGEYALPSGSKPYWITVGPDKNLWFTEFSTSKIGKVTTAGTITEYALPAGSSPFDIAAGPDGNLWFTDSATNKIGKITTSGTITEYSLPASSKPEGIASSPDGNLWFTDNGTNKIGRITTAGTITEYALPASSAPVGIAPGPDGYLWYTDYGTNKIGKIAP